MLLADVNMLLCGPWCDVEERKRLLLHTGCLASEAVQQILLKATMYFWTHNLSQPIPKVEISFYD